MRADEFLNLYKELEETLSMKYEEKDRKFSSPIFDFMNRREGRLYKERLDLCREVRNLLVHRADLEGESVVEPAQALIDTLNEVIDFVNQPPLAIDFCTPLDQILKTHYEKNVFTLMKNMEKRGFSHTPVITDEGIEGVFSVSTIFSYVLAHPDITIRQDAVVGDFAEFLPIHRHCSETFRFMDEDTTFMEARDAFERTSSKGKRLAGIFLTPHGTSKERLIGMLTPWDVMKDEYAG
ncbi:CBS domain-containing protein [Anaerolentibacter hominis]|uniref:CBS domain-containing protein n=1 Tax=Anaerolentibacter hominis TaxID=3079009 RepID=UPI0031B84D1F